MSSRGTRGSPAANTTLELRARPGRLARHRRVLIPSVPRVDLARPRTVDYFDAGLGDVAIVLAFAGLRLG